MMLLVSLIMEGLLRKMIRDNVHLDYVCPVCFNQLDKCVCDSLSWHAIQIDRNMQQHIRILNMKGYKTEYCCESHKPTDNMYITFYMDYGIGKTISLPEDFKKHGNGVSWICGRNISDEDYEKKKSEHLKSLLVWCNSLPKRR